jgi:hypothetical protein
MNRIQNAARWRAVILIQETSRFAVARNAAHRHSSSMPSSGPVRITVGLAIRVRRASPSTALRLASHLILTHYVRHEYFWF